MFETSRKGTDWSYYTDRAEQFQVSACVGSPVVRKGRGVESSAATIYEEGNTWQQRKPLSGGA
jgi:hypothetical protein